MHRTLAAFAAALRAQGIEVAPGDVLDATAALHKTGWDAQHHVRTGLQATLTRRADDAETFHRVFDAFFSIATSQTPDSSEHESEDSASHTPPSAGGGGLGDSEADIAVQMAEAAPSGGAEELRYFTQKSVAARRLTDALGEPDLRARLRQLEAEGDGDGFEAMRLKARLSIMEGQAKARAQRAFELYGDKHGQKLREEMLAKSRMDAIDRMYFDDVLRLVRRIAKQMARRYGPSKSGNKIRPNIPAIMRRASATGGVPVEILWRRRMRRKPMVYAFCDVSGSMQSYSRFFLTFLYALVEVVGDIRAFVFSSRTGEVTADFREAAPLVAMEKALQAYGGGSTDYATSMEQFLDSIRSGISNKAAIVILGDGRNNYGSPGIEHLRELRQLGGRVVWLNPEARTQWGSGDSAMPTYEAETDATYSCGSLKQLENAMEDVLQFCQRVWRS